jgi:HSP20 family protein
MTTYLTTRNNIPSLSLLEDVFFRNFFDDDFFSPLPALKKTSYPVDIYETNDSLNIDIAAVGLDKSDIKIDITDGVLKVSHKKEDKKDIKTFKDKYEYRGITKKSFDLAWRINDKFDLSKTEAELEKGLLKIKIPLAPKKQPKEIEVKIK